MPAWLTSISPSSRGRFAALALALGAIRADRPPPAATVRPAMALAVDVQGTDYELKFKNNRPELVKLLRDSVRSVLGRNFGFLRWEDGTGATDTLVLSFQQRTELQNAEFALAVRGSRVPEGVAAKPVTFETFIDIQDRVDWSPATVGPQWVARLDRFIQTSRNQMVGEVFSRVPLDLEAPTDRIRIFLDPEPAVQLLIGPDELNAAVNVPPSFRLALNVLDPGPPASNATGVVELTGCAPSPDQPGYACQMGDLTYRSSTTTALARLALLKRAKLSPVALYVQAYQPARFSSGAGGVIPP